MYDEVQKAHSDEQHKHKQVIVSSVQGERNSSSTQYHWPHTDSAKLHSALSLLSQGHH